MKGMASSAEQKGTKVGFKERAIAGLSAGGIGAFIGKSLLGDREVFHSLTVIHYQATQPT